MSEEIRIVVLLNEANPELLKEFAGISPRARAERMRILATVGLSVGKYGLPAIGASTPAGYVQPAGDSGKRKSSKRAAEPAKQERAHETQPYQEGSAVQGAVSDPSSLPAGNTMEPEPSAPKISKAAKPTLAKFVKSLG